MHRDTLVAYLGSISRSPCVAENHVALNEYIKLTTKESAKLKRYEIKLKYAADNLIKSAEESKAITAEESEKLLSVLKSFDPEEEMEKGIEQTEENLKKKTD